MEFRESMKVDGFIPPYRRRNPPSTVKRQRGCRSSCVCSTVLIIIGLSILAAIGFLLVVIIDRVQHLESYHDGDNLLYDTFRSERIECFHIEPRERMFINTDTGEATLEAVEFTEVSYIDSATSSKFHLSGYDGEILVNIRLHENTREKYLYIKYRPVSGEHFPMHKKIFLKLLHPNNPELGITKQFNTREEIAKGAVTFVEPNGEFWGANFCSTLIIDRFINNKLICVAISISDLVPHN